MPSPFQQAGAAADQSRYAPLYTDRFFTGLWSNRNLLRDAATPYTSAKYYGGSRFDSVFDGYDMELSARMTWVRRPGHSVYNSKTFPRVNSYYSFRTYVDGVTTVRVIVDTASNVYDGTGPNTQTVLWAKQPGAGKTRFLAVGNTLYFMDGVSAKQWTVATKSWQPNTAYTTGQYINDPNGNLQALTPNQPAVTVSANIASTQIAKVLGTIPGSYVYVLIVTFTASLTAYPSANEGVTFAGLTTRTALNGLTLYPPARLLNIHLNPNQLAFVYGNTVSADTPDTGTAGWTHQPQQNQGNSGSSQPSWNTALGGTTIDGVLRWTNYGPSVSDWGGTGPATAPVVSATNGVDRFWQPYSAFPLYYSVLDANGCIEVAMVVGGATGMSEPRWATGLNNWTWDGQLGWLNCGVAMGWQAGWAVPFQQAILDSNSNLQMCTVGGGTSTTGTVQPTWATAQGATTTDGAITWTCIGPGAALVSSSFSYGYAFHFVDGSVSSISPLATVPDGVLGPASKFSMTLTGTNTAAPTCNAIWIYRTPRGGSTPLFLDSIPNPQVGALSAWSYIDVLPDSALNINLPATIGVAGGPPPATGTAPEYHLGRIFLIDGNTIRYSTGPDVPPGAGNGNTMFPPLNSFVMPTLGIKLQSTTLGLIIVTVSDIRIITGRGTDQSPLVPPVIFLAGTGALSYDAVTMQDSTLYMLTTSSRGIALDPGSGVLEVGEPIGDILETDFDPASAYVTYHEASSRDTALFISDGTSKWYRMAQLPAPENGFAFGVRANVPSSAVQSVETTPGMRQLLVGPATSGPILTRDTSTHKDNGTPYPCQVRFGNVVLAQPGEVAELVFIAYDALRTGTRPATSVLLGELSGTFESLPRWVTDPPLLPASTTLYSERHYFMQNQASVWCRHLQVSLDWPAEDAATELSTYSLYGALHNERSVPAA